MSTLLIASLQAGEGRTTTAVALGARLAAEGRTVHLLRVRSPEGADAAAEDDARTLAAVRLATALSCATMGVRPISYPSDSARAGGR